MVFYEYICKKTYMMKLKENLLDWFVYTIFGYLFLIPFFNNEFSKHICGSLIIGFFAGLLNRIIRELTINNEK